MVLHKYKTCGILVLVFIIGTRTIFTSYKIIISSYHLINMYRKKKNDIHYSFEKMKLVSPQDTP